MTAILVAALSLLVVVTPTASAAHPAAPRFTGVTQIYQSNVTYPGSRFDVSVQVADPSAVYFAYFTFCQLTSSECYAPDVLHHTTGGWFQGNTSQMSQYSGMVVGVRAGFNVTIEYTNNTNVTEPSLPNAFPGLTVADTVANQYEFSMIVSPDVFGLTGVVHDAATGAALAGATVKITPGGATTTSSASGAYSFSNLTNGSYSLTVTAAGYPTFQQSVEINGQSTTQNLAVSATPRTTGPSGNPYLYDWVGGGVVAAAIVAMAAVALLRRRGGDGRSSPPGPTPIVASEGSGGPTSAPSESRKDAK